MTFKLLCWTFSTVLVLNGMSSPAVEFRIETEVFLADNPEVVQQHLTLFDGTNVYDFSKMTPQEIVILDGVSKQCQLLRPDRKTNRIVSIDSVNRATQNIHDIAPHVLADRYFFAFPRFGKAQLAKTGLLKLIGPDISYEVVGIQVTHSEKKRAYKFFADQFARFNGWITMTPPQSRLRLNEELDRYNLIPTEVTRTIKKPVEHTGIPSKVRSRHNVKWSLTDEDHSWIDLAKDYRRTFSQINSAE